MVCLFEEIGFKSEELRNKNEEHFLKSEEMISCYDKIVLISEEISLRNEKIVLMSEEINDIIQKVFSNMTQFIEQTHQLRIFFSTESIVNDSI